MPSTVASSGMLAERRTVGALPSKSLFRPRTNHRMIPATAARGLLLSGGAVGVGRILRERLLRRRADLHQGAGLGVDDVVRADHVAGIIQVGGDGVLPHRAVVALALLVVV